MLFSSFTFASIDVDIAGKKRYYTDYKKVCEKLGIKHADMVEPLDTNTMDCMSRRVNIKKFCMSQSKIFKSPFLRGYINTKMKEVVCEAGTAMKLSMECERFPKLCKKDVKKSCERLRSIYAEELESKYANKLDGKIHCYFAMKSKSDIL